MVKYRIFFFLFLFSMLNGTEYQILFGDRYEEAIHAYEEIKPIMRTRVSQLNGELNTAASIVFPEMVRYSLIRDKIETAALEVFYKKLGHDYANFSIGLFQMKPSFIERLERAVVRFDHLSEYHFISEFSENLTIEQIREMRIGRLKDIQWQIDYLICFMKMMDHFMNRVYPNLDMMDDESRIALYATAFNSGIWDNVEKIKRISKKKFFPYGPKSNENQCSYSDLSLYFYTSYLRN